MTNQEYRRILHHVYGMVIERENIGSVAIERPLGSTREHIVIRPDGPVFRRLYFKVRNNDTFEVHHEYPDGTITTKEFECATTALSAFMGEVRAIEADQ